MSGVEVAVSGFVLECTYSIMKMSVALHTALLFIPIVLVLM